jgi:hypothetical protein
MLQDADFRSGDIDIQWLERKLPSILDARPPQALQRIAAVVGALLSDRQRQPRAAPVTVATVPDGSRPGENWLRTARLDALR